MIIVWINVCEIRIDYRTFDFMSSVQLLMTNLQNKLHDSALIYTKNDFDFSFPDIFLRTQERLEQLFSSLFGIYCIKVIFLLVD